MIIEFTDTENFKIQKNNPLKVSFNCEQNIPCDNMMITFIYDGKYTSYKSVKVIFDDKTIFKGIVDTQKITAGENEKYLIIKCRSLAGHLIDNEIQPQNIKNLTDSVIYYSFLEPYGIDINHITNKPCSEIINIGKSVNMYQVINEYSKKVFNTDFRINSQGFAFFDGNINSDTYCFTDGISNLNKNSYSYTYINIENNRKGIVSKVYVRNKADETGYGLVLENNYAIKSDIQSVKYLDATPLSGNCIYDGENIINNSNKNITVITLKCPCFVFNALYGKAVVNFLGNVYDNMEISKVEYIFEKNKVCTTLTMNKKD